MLFRSVLNAVRAFRSGVSVAGRQMPLSSRVDCSVRAMATSGLAHSQSFAMVGSSKDSLIGWADAASRRSFSTGSTGVPDKAKVELQGGVRENWRIHENALGKGPYNWILRMLGFYSEESKNIRYSTMLYLMARTQAERKEFYHFFGLEDNVTNRFYLECLHVWMILLRLRKEGAKSKDIKQDVFDRFWDDITKQIHSMGVRPMALSTRVRELQDTFYGCAISYDYALGSSDALLAAALYRNVYNNKGRASHVSLLTAYVRRETDALDKMEFKKFLECDWSFGQPNVL